MPYAADERSVATTHGPLRSTCLPGPRHGCTDSVTGLFSYVWHT